MRDWLLEYFPNVRGVAGILTSKLAHSVYSTLVPTLAEVPWHKQVWNTYSSPRVACLNWLIVLQRLPTVDRLLKFGIIDLNANICVMCNTLPESHDHLFCACPFCCGFNQMYYECCGCVQDAVYFIRLE